MPTPVFAVRLRGTYRRSYMGQDGDRPIWFSSPHLPDVLRFTTSDEARAKFRTLNAAANEFYPEARIDIVEV